MDSLAHFKVPANVDELEGIKIRVNEVSHQVVKLERKIHEIEQFYSNNRKKQLIDTRNNSLRDKDKGRHVTGSHNEQDRKAASNRMQALMSQFGTIFNQITLRKGACSSFDYVDVDDVGSHHSSEPRDFNSIRKRMQATDDGGYKHVRDIYSDVRLVLKNAMKYNDERSDAHVTAKTLLAKFEEKWLLLLPKIMQEEERIEEEESLKEDFHAQLARDISNELNKVDTGLNKLREFVLQRCRKMSTLEKRELGRALMKLSADDLMKALEIVAQGNPTFQATAEEVDLDINAQSESTLWRLKYFVAEILQAQARGNQTSNGGDKSKGNTHVKPSNPYKSNSKREKDTPDGVAKPSKRKSKKVGPTV